MLIGQLTKPIAFLAHLILTQDSSRSVSCQLLLTQLPSLSYDELTGQLSGVPLESLFQSLCHLLYKTPQDALLRVVCQLSVQFWFDNSCFEAFAKQLSHMSDQQQVTTQVITELCGKVKLLQEKCMTAESDSSQPDTNNLQAYKVITLFQHSAVPIFFDIALGHFTQSKGK